MKIRMIKSYIALFFLFALIPDCLQQSGNGIIKDDHENIHYYPMKEVSNYLIAKASCNDSEEEFFILDSGFTPSCIMVDSAFFYESIYTTKMIEDKPKYRMVYWQTFYKGIMNIKVAGTNFCIENANIEVNSRFQYNNQHRYPHIMGIIGVELFSNKITILNFKENVFAITDTLDTRINLNDFIDIRLDKARVESTANAGWRYISFIMYPEFRTGS